MFLASPRRRKKKPGRIRIQRREIKTLTFQPLCARKRSRSLSEPSRSLRMFAQKCDGPSTSIATFRPRSAMSIENKLSCVRYSISCGIPIRVNAPLTS